ncbi:unnamed protein product [Adineta ricciae]|uniref:2-methoxy-6-polyprenyl-1,4-benzoquinol methylase, mitochondrial n=1 Tax=Adineta ricciae TaxID=249248 RepID=A0A815KTW9_ADIRI|nr:unnamed protein product [Adineta ricciae]
MASDDNDPYSNSLDRNDTERDLYAVLHISKDADTTTIQQAYRRLTLLYHPDKHTDPRLKQMTMDLFIQVKKAYDIINNPQKRAIYDALGMKGLKEEGWEIISRMKTAREILDEYERLAKEREERRLNQMTNTTSSVHSTIDLTDMFNQIQSSDENEEFSPDFHITEFTIEESIDIPITSQDTAMISAVATTRNQRGTGSLTTSFRHLLSDLSWFRMDLTCSQRPHLGLRYFRRITQKFHASVATTFSFINGRRAIATPGFVFSITYQLSHHLTSSLQWKTGRGSFMKGALQYDNQKWAISSAVQLGIVNTFATVDGAYRFPGVCNLRFSFKMFVFGPWIEYGIDRQFTKYTHGSAAVAISAKMGVLLRLKFNRGSQVFTIPLPLSKEILPSAIFYATVTPVLAYFVLDRFVIQPYIRLEQEREQKRRDDEERENQGERRREAMNAQEVLRSLVEQVKEKEGPQGLLILRAHYGHLTSAMNESLIKIIDVTIPLQTLVKDSTLKIETTVSKSNLTGFYDPCIGEEKSLFIKYSFHSQIHTVTYKDTDPVLLPNRTLFRTHSTTSSTTTNFGYDQVPEAEKQARVNQVFSSVADKYDLMNDVMSFGIHRIWKDYFIRVVRPDPQWNYIDVAGGTGDIAFRYLKDIDRYQPPSQIPTSATPEAPTHTYMAESLEQTRIRPTSKCVVADINPQMLAVGKQRAIDNNFHDRIQWIEANAEELPFENEQFDVYTIAFGIRNCTHIDRVVSEAYRVLKKGGRFLCLEFSQVNNTLLRYFYDQYSKTFIPPMGQIIANDWKSYQYLIESIRVFPKQTEFADLIRSCQFRYVTYENLSFGVAAIHSGYKL